MLHNFIILMAPPSEGQSPITAWIFPLAIFVIFYFFMIRPQQTKARKAKEFRAGIAKGANIVTIGGIHGKVESVSETTVTISTKGGGKLVIEKSAISAEGGVNEMEMTAKKS